MHSVSKKNGKYQSKGFGFGDFREATIKNKLEHFPVKILLSRMLKEHRCSNKLVDIGKIVASKSGTVFGYNCAKQVLSLNSILIALNNGRTFTEEGIKTVCIIGDGYAYFANLIRQLDPDIKVSYQY